MASAAAPGTTPAFASAAARAASVSSMAWSQARSEVASRTASGRKRPLKRLDPKEGGLLVALQVDVEAQGAGLASRHQRATLGRVRDRSQHLVCLVRLDLVG